MNSEEMGNAEGADAEGADEKHDQRIRIDSDKKHDQRIRIDYNDRKYNCKSYFMLGQLKATIPSGHNVVGTCIYIKLQDNLILTAAHNIVCYSRFREEMVFFKDPLVYIARQGIRKWGKKKFLGNGRIHPKYNRYPDCGFDIGLFAQWKDEGNGNKESFQLNKTRKNDVILSFADPEDIKKGMSVEVAGYPGEKEGYAYTQTGVVRAVTRNKEGYVIWHDCETTPGNAGSPIMITDKKISKDKGVEKVIIGIHTGYDVDLGLGIGTLITPSIFKWIQKTCDEENKPKYLAFLASHEESRFQMDALKLKNVLEKCHYKVTIILGDTPDKIMKEVENFTETVGSRDVVIFYITTHGANPSDHGGKLKFLFQNQYLDSAQLTKKLVKIRALSMLVLVHSCYAGAAIIDGKMRKNDEEKLQSEYMRKLKLMTGKATICAGPPDQVTWGQIFPNAVANSFKKALKKKKKLRLTQLASDISGSVEEAKMAEQLIDLDIKGQDFYLYFPERRRSWKHKIRTVI